MQKIIASYLVQKKECSLPGIGNFKITTKPAALDIANKIFFPPTDEIIFTENDVHLRNDLVNYISIQQNIDQDKAAEKISNWCQSTKEKLKAGEKIIFESIGSLQKNAVGNIFLQRQKALQFYDTMPAERVIHKNEEHPVLVGDKETTSVVMNEFYKDGVTARKQSWKIWAIAFFCISLLVLIIHFFNHNFSDIGNQINLSPASPSVLHKSITS